MIFVISLTTTFASQIYVKGDLPGPRSIYGYVTYSNNGSAIPDGITVTFLDLNTGYSAATATQNGTGLYYFTFQNGANSGDIIVINCSMENSYGTWLHSVKDCALNSSGPADRVDLRVKNECISIFINNTFWYNGILNSYNVNKTNSESFNISNYGNIKVNVAVQGENITFDDNTWYINSTPDHNRFTIRYKENNNTWQPINWLTNNFKTNLYPNYDKSWSFYKISPYVSWQNFNLNMTMPVSADFIPPFNTTVNITFWAIKT